MARFSRITLDEARYELKQRAQMPGCHGRNWIPVLPVRRRTHCPACGRKLEGDRCPERYVCGWQEA